jgi:DnaJ-domain-containing protein 1
MSGAFQYRPKFVDIRVRPPKEGEREEDVHTLKPGERRCDHPDCLSPATARAPKSREMLNEHYWFCQPHAAEYNKSWNFYAGMSEDEIRSRQEEESVTGGRPTWQFKASKFSREAAAFAAGAGRGFADPFGMFRGGDQASKPQAAPVRQLGKIERAAFADLDLDEASDKAAIRARYKELVKRCHPDANGGDRSAEHKLQRVIKAYKSLQKAGLA